MKTIRMAPASGRRRLFGTFRGAAALAAALVVVGVAVPAAAQEPELTTYRYWRAPDVTQVEVFASVPWSLLSFERTGETETAGYAGTLEVRDSNGLLLMSEEWTGRIATPALTASSRSRAASMDHFTLRLKPGTYTFAVEVTDSASGRSAQVEERVTAPAEAPAHSDLVVAASLDRAEGEDEAVDAAIVRGDLVARPNLEGVITAEQPRLGLFAELYRTSVEPESAQAVVTVTGVDRTFQHQTAPQQRVYPAGGGVEALGVNLAGLPPGSYRVALRIAFPTDTVVATHELEMLPPGAGVAQLASEEVYAGLSEAQLDSLAAPMRYIMTPTERAGYEVLRGADAKRTWLARFWAGRAAATGVTAEELRTEWRERLEFVNVQFRPGATGRDDVPGWQTDRGRTYLTYGPPAERYVEAQRQGNTNPWEVWRYTQGRAEKFVFWDQTGFGNYILVYSSDPNILTMPGWEEYFTDEALQIIRSF